MEITHGSQQTFQDTQAKHRAGGLAFKYLSLGQPSTPTNFMLVLAHQESFYSPRHRHNFDQFRYAVKGDFSLGPDLVLREGQLAYHPEGVYYGPQEDDGLSERVCLVLQFGGASGEGYVSLEQIKAAHRQLSQCGKFEGGRYFADADGADGIDGVEGVDGYEAGWSQAMGGKKLVYPKARYNAPILMEPKNFEFHRYENGKGVWRKVLGVFSEREVRAQMWKIDEQGEMSVGGDEAIHLLYVLDGEGMVGDDKLIRESTVRLYAGTSATIISKQGMELLHFVMPML